MLNFLSFSGTSLLGFGVGATVGIIIAITSGVIFLLILLGSGIRIVQQSTVKIVERFGKYKKTLSAGINVIVPIIDRVRDINEIRRDYKGHISIRKVNYIDLRERVYDFPGQDVITQDNVTLKIDALLYYQITDPFKSLYEVENLAQAIEKLTQTTLRNVIGELELDGTLSSRDTINTKLRIILDDATDKWGVKVTRVEIKDITPPKNIRDAMDLQMTAEREKRKDILEAEGKKRAMVLNAEGQRDKLAAEAEGEKIKQVLEAEGFAEAKIKVAKAEAESIRLVKEALGVDKMEPAQYLIAIKYVEALKDIASKNKNEKLVFMPFESSGLLSSLGSIKKLFDELPKTKKEE